MTFPESFLVDIGNNMSCEFTVLIIPIDTDGNKTEIKYVVNVKENDNE